MMFEVIKFHTDKKSLNSCFELGPGSGIWTKKLLMKNPNSKFFLMDISKEMSNQFNMNIGERKNVTFKLGDF